MSEIAITAKQITRRYPANWTVTGVKRTGRGMEHVGFSAKLRVDGKIVAEVVDQGNGGCFFYYPAKGKTYADVDALVKQAGEITGSKFEPLDELVAEMVQDAENLKQAKSFAKKTACPVVIQLQTADHPEYEYTVLALPSIDGLAAALAKRNAVRYEVIYEAPAPKPALSPVDSAPALVAQAAQQQTSPASLALGD